MFSDDLGLTYGCPEDAAAISSFQESTADSSISATSVNHGGGDKIFAERLGLRLGTTLVGTRLEL